VYDWDSYVKTVRELQPNALMAICGPDIRWVGNENGLARESEWSVQPTLPDHRWKSDDTTAKTPSIDTPFRWHPAECDVSIRPGWFTTPQRTVR